MKESVLSFEERTTQPCLTYFQIAGKYWKSFKTKLVNYYFWWLCKFLILSESPSFSYHKAEKVDEPKVL